MLETTLGKLFDKAVHQYDERIAFQDNNRAISYGQLGKEVNKMASVLLDLGVESQDRVAVWMENSIEYVIADFALIKIGAVRVPMNTFLSNDEVVYRIEDSNAEVLICEKALLERVKIIKKKTTGNLIILSDDDEEKLNYKKLMSEAPTQIPSIKIEEDDLTMIMYTGGTTGRSKGVIHTHKSVSSIIYSEIVELEVERGVVMLHVAPLPHAAGFMVLPGLLRGGKQILHKRFEPKAFCETVERERVMFVFLVPTMIYSILDMPEKHNFDFSSLTTMVYGAAPMAPNRIAQAIEVFGPVLTQIYSQAEVANQTTILTKDDHFVALQEDEKRLSSCGRSIIMAQVKILDENDVECLPGQVGEIVTKGPHMMTGYWNQDKETEKTIRNGWLHTGDIAYQDENGYVYLVDRKNDMIISGGFNVYTTTVEKVLFEHPNIRQATVVGVPDNKWGESIKAFVVSNVENPSESSLIEYCKTKLAKYEVPKSIEFVKSLPLTAYGKIDKKELRKPYWNSFERQVN